MEKLSHSLDFKLIFATLSNTNGRVSISTLTPYISESFLPKDCLQYWKAAASQDGSLTLEGFLKGFQEALKADSGFPEVVFKEKTKVKEGLCSTEELESVLMLCNQKKLASALAKSRREVYASQKSVEQETTNRKGGDGRQKNGGQVTLQRQATRQPINETEVLMQVDQMLRSRRNDDVFVSDIMGRLTNILRQPYEQVIMVPASHPYATIRRSKSVKEERTNPNSLSRSHPRLPTENMTDNSANIMRSTSVPGKKPEKGGKSTKKHYEEIPFQIAYTEIGPQSKSMHNLNNTGTAKDMLHGWMERSNSPQKNEPTPRHASSHHQLYYQQHSFQATQQLPSPTKHVLTSTPDMTGYPFGNRVMTQKEMKQAEQYATLTRAKDKPSKRTDPTHPTKPLKNECKTLKSDYIAEIHRLRSEKEALIQQLFEQQAASTNDDSLMSVL